jgi:hypothetical protein
MLFVVSPPVSHVAAAFFPAHDEHVPCQDPSSAPKCDGPDRSAQSAQSKSEQREGRMTVTTTNQTKTMMELQRTQQQQ